MRKCPVSFVSFAKLSKQIDPNFAFILTQASLMLTIMAEVKMGEGSPKGGKGATEESGSGEVRHSGDGDTRGGDTAMQGREKHSLNHGLFEAPSFKGNCSKRCIPGDPVKGVAELGGVVERGEDASKAAATAAALAADWGPFW